tara:strand:- start:184 stop:486 length:303 start_codon:yes stop_codon:yes gene_type:complete
MKLEYTYKTMTWDQAIDYSIQKGMYIPNKRQCEELKLFGCWTSTTDEKNYTKAYVGCCSISLKQDRHRVIMISETNYTEDHIAYRIGDEGDGYIHEKLNN